MRHYRNSSEYQASKAFFLGSVTRVIRWHDEREMPVKGNALHLMHYLRERQAPLSREELKNFTAFHRTYVSRKMFKAAVHDWVHRFPKAPEALWALAQAQQADGRLQSAMTTLRPLLNDEPNNPHYLGMAADLEMTLYQSQRSYLNHVSNERTLGLLERLLEVEVDDKVGIFRKIAHVYTLDRDYVTSLTFLKRAAKSGTQGEKNGATSDALWIEAAQMSIEIKESGKARGYLFKAMAQNPQSASARESLQELPILEQTLPKNRKAAWGL